MQSSTCHLQLKHQSILVEPDVPIYDLPEVMQQIGYPLVPSTPLFDKIKVCLSLLGLLGCCWCCSLEDSIHVSSFNVQTLHCKCTASKLCLHQ